MRIKVMLILLVSVILLSGCTNSKENGKTDDNNNNNNSNKVSTMTCVKTETDEDGLKTVNNMEVSYQNEKVIKVKETSEVEVNPNFLDFTFNFSTAFAEKFSNIEGMNIKYTKEDNNVIKSVVEVDYTKLNLDSIKDVLGDDFENNSNAIYTSNNVSLSQFKESHLDGYDCN